MSITAKTERAIRKQALDQIFGKIKRSGQGNHKSKSPGIGDEHTGDYRNYQFGDALDKVSMTESLKNAQINHGIGDFTISEDDLVVEETLHKSQMSTVLMIDISHSMILYGEDRITPAKKVAMALAELITTRYPKDTLDILVFGNDAWQIEIKGFTIFKSRTVSHQHSSWFAIGHGFTSAKAKHQQANFYDNRWETQLYKVARWRIL